MLVLPAKYLQSLILLSDDELLIQDLTNDSEIFSKLVKPFFKNVTKEKFNLALEIKRDGIKLTTLPPNRPS